MNSIKITTLNKGPAFYKNSIMNVKQVLNENSIDILAIQELNVRIDDNDTPLEISDYTLIQDKLMVKNGLSRAGFLIHKDVNFKVRWDLTNTDVAHVEVAVFTSKTKKTGTVQAQNNLIRKTAPFFNKSKM